MLLKRLFLFTTFLLCCHILPAQKQDSIVPVKFTIAKVVRPKKTHSFKQGETVKLRVNTKSDSLDIVGSETIYTGTIHMVTQNTLSLSLSEETQTITYKDFTERYTTNVYKNDPVLFPLHKPPVKEIRFSEIADIGKERNINKAASIVGIYAFIGGLVTAPIYATNFNTGKMNGRAYYTWLSGAMALSAISFGISYTFGVKKYNMDDSPEISKRRKWMVAKK